MKTLLFIIILWEIPFILYIYFPKFGILFYIITLFIVLIILVILSREIKNLRNVQGIIK